MTQRDIIIEQECCVDELRRRMKGKMSEEMFADYGLFRRFLKARRYNLDAAEDMLSKHLQWRKTSKIDSILLDYNIPEIIDKFVPLSFIGYDKEGCPVNYCAYANMDVKGLAKCVKKSEFSKFIMCHLQKDVARLKAQSEKLGRKLEKWSYILNFENFSLANATDKTSIEIVIGLIKMYDANYPETLKTGYLINASFYFTVIWSVVKPFLSAETTRKIKIFGKNGWQEEFQKDIGADNLPAFLGGNITDSDGDPMCTSFIRHGGVIPEKYYVHRDQKGFSNLPGVKRLVVNRRSIENVKLEVEKPGFNIEWEFDVNNRDIIFSLIYKDPENETDGEEIVPKQRVDTIIQSESGIVICDKPGTYVLQFDNSYSWVHNKIIFYYANVLKPNDVIAQEED